MCVLFDFLVFMILCLFSYNNSVFHFVSVRLLLAFLLSKLIKIFVINSIIFFIANTTSIENTDFRLLNLSYYECLIYVYKFFF